MTPKIWPKDLTYSRESVGVDINLLFLQNALSFPNFEDREKISSVIQEKSTYPGIRVRKITPSLKLDGKRPHLLADQTTLRGRPNYGIFATNDIEQGTEIGEYIGEVYVASSRAELSDRYKEQIKSSGYLWILEINDTLFLMVDSQNIANEMALVNDYRGIASKPNVSMKYLIHKGHFYPGYVTIADIKKGEELLINYGEMYCVEKLIIPKK